MIGVKFCICWHIIRLRNVAMGVVILGIWDGEHGDLIWLRDESYRSWWTVWMTMVRKRELMSTVASRSQKSKDGWRVQHFLGGCLIVKIAFRHGMDYGPVYSDYVVGVLQILDLRMVKPRNCLPSLPWILLMFLLFVCSKCREEADRLIGILRSSVVDNGVDVKKAAAAAATTHEVKPFTPNTLHRTRSPANGAQQSNGVLSDAQRWREELTKNRQEQKFKFWPVGFDSENHASPAAGGSEV